MTLFGRHRRAKQRPSRLRLVVSLPLVYGGLGLIYLGRRVVNGP